MLKVCLAFCLTSFLMAQDSLLFYCGITMVSPMQKLVKIFEQKNDVRIKIIQGGSEDLYISLSKSKKGDLYLPGSKSYIEKYKKYNYFIYKKLVGYNKLAIFVQKNNPKNIKNINDLLREDVLLVIGNPQTCSIGKEILKIFKNSFSKILMDKAVIYAIDSRDMNQMLKNGDVDVGLNWKATAFLPKNKIFLDVIPIESKKIRKELYLTVLSFSKNQNSAKEFVDFVSSKEGIEIMQEYGFLDE